MRRVGIHLGAFAVALSLALPVRAEWVSMTAKVHIGPWGSTTDPVVETPKRGHEVQVLERQGDWARISPYQKPKELGMKGRLKVARWVKLRNLTTDQPIALPKAACEDPGIAPDALPKAGPGALTDEEADILCRGARQILATDRCERVVYGDKSLSKPGSFFVNCGGKNFFFTAADLAPEPAKSAN